MRLKLRAFGGVVVYEDEAVQPEPEFLGQRHYICRFRLPVDAPRNKMLHPQRELGMGAEGFYYIFVVVFATQAEQHARLMLRQHEFLQCAPRRIEHDTLGAVFAAHALPERLIAIQYNHLVGRHPKRLDLPGGQRSERGEEGRFVRDMPQHVAIGVVVVRHRVEFP